VAYTLQVGREAMESRLAIITDSFEDLLTKLENYFNNLTFDENIFQNTLISLRESENEIILKSFPLIKKHNELASLWIHGHNIDWHAQKPCKAATIISLPSYPFAREKYWFSPSKSNQPDDSFYHPYFSKSDVTINNATVTKTITKETYLLNDHIIMEASILHASAIIEIAYAAVSNVFFLDRPQIITNCVFINPLILTSSSIKVCASFERKENRISAKLTQTDTGRNVENIAEMMFSTNIDDVDKTSISINIDDILSKCNKILSGKQFYKKLSQEGFVYGNKLRLIEKINIGDNQALAILDQSQHRESETFKIDPAILDAAFQCVFLVGNQVEFQDSDIVYMPFSIDKITVIKSLKATHFIYSKLELHKAIDFNNKIKIFSLYLLDSNGIILAKVNNFSICAFDKNRFANLYKINNVAQYQFSFLLPTWEESKLQQPKENVDTNIQNTKISIILTNNKSSEKNLFFKKINNPKSNVDTINTVFNVGLGEAYERQENNKFIISTTNYADYEKLIDVITCNSTFSVDVIYLWNLSPENAALTSNLVEYIKELIASIFLMCKAMLLSKNIKKINIIFSYQSHNVISKSACLALSGFAKSIYLENPKFKFKIIEFDAVGFAAIERIIRNELDEVNDINVSEIRYRSEKRFVKTFRKINESELADKYCQEFNNIKLLNNGVYVITGGMGGLGVIFARHIVSQVNANLFFIGRSSISEEKMKVINSLSSRGSSVNYISADVSDFNQLREVLTNIREQHTNINGVIHCAGIINDKYVIKKNIADFYSVIRPKIFGIIYLDDLTKIDQLDFFIITSSTSGLIGNAGQSDYSYANAFLDNYAEERNQLIQNEKAKGRFLSIAWPLWENGGMSVSQQLIQLMWDKYGLAVLDDINGIKAYELILKSTLSNVAVLYGDIAKYSQFFEKNISSQLKNRTHGLEESSSKEDLNKQLIAYLKQIISDELKIPIPRLVAAASLESYGIDSIVSMKLLNALDKEFEKLPKTLFFEYQTIKQLSNYLIENNFKDVANLFMRYIPHKNFLEKSISKEIETDKSNVDMIDKLSENQIDALLALLSSKEQ
jgi:polyketide synthase PksN